MQRTPISLVFRSLFALAVVLLLNPSINAQLFGIPAPAKGNAAWKEITTKMPQDEPIACWVWNEAGELNPEGNFSDQWYADAGLQKSLGKIKAAIAKVTKEQSALTAGQFAETFGWTLLSKSGSLVLEQVNIEAQVLRGTLLVQLGEDEEDIRDFMAALMIELDVDAQRIGDEKVYVFEEASATFGVHNGYLIGAFGTGQWMEVVQRIDDADSTPEWLTQRLDTVSTSRRSQFVFASVEQAMELLPPEALEDPEFQRISETLDLKGLKSLSLAIGADSMSNVSMLHLECDKEGLTSVLDVPTIDRKKLAEFPEDSISAIAFRFSTETLVELIEKTVPPEILQGFLDDVAERTALNLKDDVINHLEGTVRYYQSGSAISPKQVVILKLKDEARFRDSLEQINETVAGLAAEQGFEFSEKEKNGMKLYAVKNDFASAYWAVNGGELYVSSNSRAIGTHLRKYIKGNNNSILDGELASKILTESKTMGFEGPIGLQYFDFDQVIEVALPLLQGAFAFIPPEMQDNFNFGANDLPPIESLLGMRPAQSMLFKSPQGYIAIARYDTPMPLDLSAIAVSGVAVGMLLPAVQQVREAARRTQSMNNQRQLALALLNYEAANGSFPPAFTVDADGTPLLSWRVAILPYLEQKDLYDRFHHDEPWDSEHNIQLLNEMPDLFKNPSTAGQPGWTDYMAPTTDDSILSASGKETKRAQITDGSSDTILLFEVGVDQQAPWTSPQDLEIETLDSMNFDNGHAGVMTYALCDGSVLTAAKSRTVESFIQACKKSDGVGLENINQ